MLKGAPLGKIIRKFEEQPEIRKDKMKKKESQKGHTAITPHPNSTAITVRVPPPQRHPRGRLF